MSIHVAAAAATLVDCPRCEVSGGPWRCEAEAAVLAEVHNRLHHGGVPVAEARVVTPRALHLPQGREGMAFGV